VDFKHDLEISSCEELVAQEEEIVRRINERPNGGRLLLLDPLRLLGEVGVRLSDRAIVEWEAATGEGLFARSGYEAAYDAVAISDPSAAGVTVRVAGLFTRGAL
jgi:hypothetical protein